MLVSFLLSSYAFSLGVLQDGFDSSNLIKQSNFYGVQPLYVGIIIPWTIDPNTLQAQQTIFEQAAQANTQLILYWDPVLPRQLSDTIFAIVSGLQDKYITALYDIIKGVQVKFKNFLPIISPGTAVNQPASYAANSSLYRQLVVRLKSLAASHFTSIKIALSVSARNCEDVQFFYKEECDLNGTNCTKIQNPAIDFAQYSFNGMHCQTDINDYYAGDSFVDWIILEINNDNPDAITDPDQIFHKTFQLASRLSQTKPLLAVVKSVTDKNTVLITETASGNKTYFIDRLLKLADYYSQQHSYNYNVLKVLMLHNKESSQDTGFFDSIKGDTVTTTTGNGDKLYSYQLLKKLSNLANILGKIKQNITGTFVNNIIDQSVLSTGSICNQGFFGDLEYAGCQPCTAGTYNDQIGQMFCKLCPIGQYQDDAQQTECKQCPSSATTVFEGTDRVDYCVCKANYEMENRTCVVCPKNFYARTGGICEICPADSRFSSGRGEVGKGCMCLAGYHWVSDERSCKKGSADGDILVRKVSIIIGLVGFVGVILL